MENKKINTFVEEIKVLQAMQCELNYKMGYLKARIGFVENKRIAIEDLKYLRDKYSELEKIKNNIQDTINDYFREILILMPVRGTNGSDRDIFVQ